MNKVVHFEIPVDDMSRAKEFYRSVFNWEISEWPLKDGTSYVGVKTVQTDDEYMPKEAGAINGGIVERSKDVPAPVITIAVDSIDDYLKKIKTAGGSILVEKGEVPDMGYYSYIKDSEGNNIGLWENMEK